MNAKSKYCAHHGMQSTNMQMKKKTVKIVIRTNGYTYMMFISLSGVVSLTVVAGLLEKFDTNGTQLHFLNIFFCSSLDHSKVCLPSLVDCSNIYFCINCFFFFPLFVIYLISWAYWAFSDTKSTGYGFFLHSRLLIFFSF